jgi:hypothetical protein
MATIERKQIAFRLSTALMERLRVEAKRENRSLNNLVEVLLTESLDRRPNPETMAAIEEARSGKYAGELDASSFDAFMKSVNALD